jgi:hypothetical protein
MATIPAVMNPRPNRTDFISTACATWTGLATGSLDGAWVNLSNFRDRSVAVSGTFDGGTITMQVSNDPWSATGSPTNVFTAQDTALAAFTFTVAAQKTMLTPSMWIRPLLSSAGAASNLTISLFAAGSYAV